MTKPPKIPAVWADRNRQIFIERCNFMTEGYSSVQLRDPKNNFIFNFNFDNKMKNL